MSQPTPRTVERYLRWAFEDEVSVAGLAPLPGGVHDNIHARVVVGGVARQVVIRVAPIAPPGSHARAVKPYDIAAEFAALRDLHTHTLPTPCVWGLDDAGAHFGSAAFTMQYIEGATVQDAAAREPERVLRAYVEALVCMNGIGAADVPSVTAPPRDGAPADLVGWIRRQADALPTPPRVRAGLRTLADAEPEGRPRPAFGNGDVGPQNFIYQANGAAAVVDWEYVGYADPLSELMLLHTWPPQAPFLGRYPVDRMYCDAMDIDPAVLEWYELYAALTAWIFAASDGDGDDARRAAHEDWVGDMLRRL
ncbi:phosphotransferase [Candidatus Poribacteria bacterium]|nr:phosphotransferase [Candidatus Poribacteria bacterium]MBT5531795.1 phosphotransferase [Candidatus Poribacteria bacterium]MBT5715139.1 phosphotransferase [Candidatus Poribacteria bacterium]MBT7098860.1 phosphotransferase [Candidatus Poribacteria bacterium]MBT7807400.1 phosphotransferase [Candidatus Poribacteria bacterium]